MLEQQVVNKLRPPLPVWSNGPSKRKNQRDLSQSERELYIALEKIKMTAIFYDLLDRGIDSVDGLRLLKPEDFRSLSKNLKPFEAKRFHRLLEQLVKETEYPLNVSSLGKSSNKVGRTTSAEFTTPANNTINEKLFSVENQQLPTPAQQYLDLMSSLFPVSRKVLVDPFKCPPFYEYLYGVDDISILVDESNAVIENIHRIFPQTHSKKLISALRRVIEVHQSRLQRLKSQKKMLQIGFKPTFHKFYNKLQYSSSIKKKRTNKKKNVHFSSQLQTKALSPRAANTSSLGEVLIPTSTASSPNPPGKPPSLSRTFQQQRTYSTVDQKLTRTLELEQKRKYDESLSPHPKSALDSPISIDNERREKEEKAKKAALVHSRARPISVRSFTFHESHLDREKAPSLTDLGVFRVARVPKKENTPTCLRRIPLKEKNTQNSRQGTSVSTTVGKVTSPQLSPTETMVFTRLKNNVLELRPHVNKQDDRSLVASAPSGARSSSARPRPVSAGPAVRKSNLLAEQPSREPKQSIRPKDTFSPVSSPLKGRRGIEARPVSVSERNMKEKIEQQRRKLTSSRPNSANAVHSPKLKKSTVATKVHHGSSRYY